MSNKNVALRVRMTEEESAMCRAAMEKLQLTEISTFVRWALANSCAQVLGTAQPVKQQKAAPKPRPVSAPKPASKPKAPVVTESAVSTLLGVPLYSSVEGPRAIDQFGDDDWA